MFSSMKVNIFLPGRISQVELVDNAVEGEAVDDALAVVDASVEGVVDNVVEDTDIEAAAVVDEQQRVAAVVVEAVVGLEAE